MLLMAEPIQNPKPYLKRFDKANTATEPSEASRQTLSKLKHPYVSFVFIIGHASCGLARTIATTPHRFFFQCLYVECDSTLPFMGIETFDRWCAHTHTTIRYASGGAFMNKFGSVFFSNRNFFSRSVTCRVTLGVFGIKSVYFSGCGHSNRLLKAISY